MKNIRGVSNRSLRQLLGMYFMEQFDLKFTGITLGRWGFGITKMVLKEPNDADR